MGIPRSGFDYPLYQFVWAYQSILVSILLIVNTAYNSTYYALTIYTSAHFKVLATLLRDIDKYITPNDHKNNSEKSSAWLDVTNENIFENGTDFANTMALNQCGEIEKENNKNRMPQEDAYPCLHPEDIRGSVPQPEDFLVNCVKYHQALLLYVEDVQSVFSTVLFIYFSLNGALMCLTVFQSTVGSGKSSSFKFVGAMITVWVPVFLMCWFGELLTEQSEAVERAIYGCKWFDASPRFKKYTQFIIMKSQKSVRLLAGNFFAVSLEGFASIAHTVYAYYTVLMQTQQ
ncbi:odorant receptor 4-like [Cryptotermes secundus]|uniref:odorant receptor 4-like n=1 Tax=Cryptotermes secundus TaxID=105785 RepID=UPI001454DF35|nr:odorant receptor 4-like [Cryptotermes secundus]